MCLDFKLHGKNMLQVTSNEWLNEFYITLFIKEKKGTTKGSRNALGFDLTKIE